MDRLRTLTSFFSELAAKVAGILPDWHDVASSTLLQSSIGAAVGAGLGAWAAFELENRRQARKARTKEWRDGTFALFQLAGQCRDLMNVLGFVKQLAVQPRAAVVFGFPDNIPRLNMESLRFLLDRGEPELLQALDIHDAQFGMVFRTLEMRTEPAQAVQAAATREPPVPSGVEVQVLEDITIAAIEAHKRAVVSWDNVVPRFRRFMEQHFPEKQVLDVEWPNEREGPTPS